AGGADHRIRLWDIASGKELLPPEGHEGSVRCVSFSPDGKTVVSAGHWADGSLRFWEAASSKELYRLECIGDFQSFVLTPDGRILAFLDRDERIRFHDATSRKELHRLKHKFPARALAVSPDGKLLAAVHGAGDIHLWEMATGKECRRLGKDTG